MSFSRLSSWKHTGSVRKFWNLDALREASVLLSGTRESCAGRGPCASPASSAAWAHSQVCPSPALLPFKWFVYSAEISTALPCVGTHPSCTPFFPAHRARRVHGACTPATRGALHLGVSAHTRSTSPSFFPSLPPSTLSFSLLSYHLFQFPQLRNLYDLLRFLMKR